MQVAGEVYLQLLAHLAEAVRAVGDHPAGRAVNGRPEYVLSTSRGLLALSWLPGLPGRVREVDAEAGSCGAGRSVSRGRGLPGPGVHLPLCLLRGSQLVDALLARWQQADELGGKMHATEVKPEEAAATGGGAGDGVKDPATAGATPSPSPAPHPPPPARGSRAS